MGVEGGLAVSCKSEYVGGMSGLTHLDEFVFECCVDCMACGWRCVCLFVAVKPTFAVDTVERAPFTVAWQEIDAE